MNPPAPPPPPPQKEAKFDPFKQKLMEKFKGFQGSATQEVLEKLKKSEDVDETCMSEADGIGIIEKEEDKTNAQQCQRCEKWIKNEIVDYHRLCHSSQILDWLYLGGEINATNEVELEKRTNISYILNAAYECPNYYPQKFNYLHLELYDLIGIDISEHFEKVFNFIYNCKQEKKNILIHCIQGVSRSSTLVLMYLMRGEGMTLRDAFERTISQRPIIRPNPTFCRTLLDLELKLFGKNTITAKEMNKLVQE
ncbi:hypothetical protein pb186bvf_013281 [Paramecium bursaria]